MHPRFAQEYTSLLFPASYYEKYNSQMIGPKGLIKAVPKGLVRGQYRVLKRVAKSPRVFLHKFGGVVAFNGEMVFCGS